MRKRTMRVLSLLTVAVLSASLLAGCGGGSATETTAAQTSEGEETAAGEETEDYSDVVITYGMTSAWDTVNPYGSSSGSMYQQLVADKIYDRLAFIEEAGSDITARGAASWESADDGMAAIFHLDENATWHDGEPVTAEDWVFTAQLITDPDFPFGLKSEFNSWAGTTDAGIEESENSVMVEALDDYTLK